MSKRGTNLLIETLQAADEVNSFLAAHVERFQKDRSVSPEAVGTAVYSARAMLHCIDRNVWEMMVENIP
jgi:hypothetical protein